MTEPPVFIVNPAAAHGRVGRRRDVVARAIRRRFQDAEVLFTTGRGDAVRLAHAAADRAVVVACGGDGTVHEVARGLVESGGVAALGILGIGTGNDLARSLGMPRGLESGLDALKTGGFGRMDYLRIALDDAASTVPVFNNVGFGFDAFASERAIRWKRLPGSLGYTVGILEALLTWGGPAVTVRADDRIVETRFMFVTLGNGHSSGGGYLITPHASPDDGRIDVCVVSRLGILRAIRMMPATRTGRHLDAREVTMMVGTEVEITAAEPVPVHGDGEILSSTCRRLTATMVEGGLAVFAPRYRSAGDGVIHGAPTGQD